MYLKTTFVDHGISSYCTHVCTLYGHSLSERHRTPKGEVSSEARHGIRLMCCISNSPYQEKNCSGFKDKSGFEQRSLTDYNKGDD